MNNPKIRCSLLTPSKSKNSFLLFLLHTLRHQIFLSFSPCFNPFSKRDLPPFLVSSNLIRASCREAALVLLIVGSRITPPRTSISWLMLQMYRISVSAFWDFAGMWFPRWKWRIECAIFSFMEVCFEWVLVFDLDLNWWAWFWGDGFGGISFVSLVNLCGISNSCKMEVASGLNPRPNSHALEREKDEQKEVTDVENLESEPVVHDYHFHSISALEILRETVRILRYNLTGFMAILAVLICPVSAVLLSNVLVNQSLVRRLTLRLLLVAKSCGLPLKPFIKHSSQKLSEMVISVTLCFPLFITLSLLSKAAVVYSVDCTYSRKKFDSSKFYVIVSNIWKRVVMTYLWVCLIISSFLTLFIVLLVVVSSVFLVMGFPSDLILYPAMVVGFLFSIIIANAIIICNIAIVISVLEDVSGPQALLRSSSLIKGQTQVGLLIFLGSTIGMAFIEGLFEHRVKTLSYGDGSSRIWEGPLLVLMYSFVVLIDSMMSAVFYFSCKSYRLESGNGEDESVLEVLAIPSGSTIAQSDHLWFQLWYERLLKFVGVTEPREGKCSSFDSICGVVSLDESSWRMGYFLWRG